MLGELILNSCSVVPSARSTSIVSQHPLVVRQVKRVRKLLEGFVIAVYRTKEKTRGLGARGSVETHVMTAGAPAFAASPPLHFSPASSKSTPAGTSSAECVSPRASSLSWRRARGVLQSAPYLQDTHLRWRGPIPVSTRFVGSHVAQGQGK